MNIRTIGSGSSGNAHLIDDSHTKLLLDCGITWKRIQQTLNYHTSEIEAVLVTHLHMDHCKGVRDAMRAGVDVFMTRETAEALGVEGNHRAQMIDPKVQFQIGSWIILPFSVQHDCPGAVGFLLHSMETQEKLVYLTDSYYSRYTFKGVTHLLLEINYDMQTLNENVASGIVPVEMKNRLLQSHFSLENAVDFLKACDLSKVQQIWIIHSSDTNANRERIKRTIQSKFGKPVYIAG
ncbi:MAG: MBL fold metallo-hydrolase [Dehalococcoidales bacterium]|nr:MBL fold metallo-hydrolase [Dehalococcoidales bacterium]